MSVQHDQPATEDGSDVSIPVDASVVVDRDADETAPNGRPWAHEAAAPRSEQAACGKTATDAYWTTGEFATSHGLAGCPGCFGKGGAGQ